MSRAAITFDFHNTLAHCDDWFDLEVNGLVSSFLKWQSLDRGIPIDPQVLWSADQAYKQLRFEIREHGNELNSEACVAAVLDELSLSYHDQDIARGVDQVMRATLNSARPMPGAIDTINELASANVPLGIVSSAVHHPFLVWTLEMFGMLDAFDSVTTSASAGYYKSRPEIYLHALSELNAVPELSIHVGDSHRYDVAGARRIGMRTVLVAGRSGHDESLARPDLTLASLVGSTAPILALLGRGEVGRMAEGVVPIS